MIATAVTSCKEAPKKNAPTPEAVAETTVDPMVALCLEDTSRNPIEVLERLMSRPECPMHGPTHHVLVGAALLTAYNNCLPDSSKLDLEAALAEMSGSKGYVEHQEHEPYVWRRPGRKD